LYTNDEEIKDRIEKIRGIVSRKIEKITLDMFLNKDQFFAYIEKADYFNQYNDIGIMANVDVGKLFSWLEAEADFRMDYKLLRFLNSRYRKNIVNEDLQPNDFDDVANVRLLQEKYEQKCVSLQNSFDRRIYKYKHIAGEYEKLIEYMEERIEAAK